MTPGHWSPGNAGNEGRITIQERSHKLVTFIVHIPIYYLTILLKWLGKVFTLSTIFCFGNWQLLNYWQPQNRRRVYLTAPVLCIWGDLRGLISVQDWAPRVRRQTLNTSESISTPGAAETKRPTRQGDFGVFIMILWRLLCQKIFVWVL